MCYRNNMYDKKKILKKKKRIKIMIEKRRKNRKTSKERFDSFSAKKDINSALIAIIANIWIRALYNLLDISFLK